MIGCGDLRSVFLGATEEVCGRTKRLPRPKETWCWNEVEKEVKKKWICFKRMAGDRQHWRTIGNYRVGSDSRRAVANVKEAHSEVCKEIEH